MKEKRMEISYTLPVFVILLLIIIWALYGIFREEEAPEKIKVSVILEDSSSSRWDTFKLGLETAAKEEAVDLTIVSTNLFSDASEERSLVEQKVNDGAEGIILAPYSAENMEQYYESLAWDISVCLVASGTEDMAADKNIHTVLPGVQSTAELVLNQVKADFGQQLRQKHVLLYADHYHEAFVQQVIEIVRENLEEFECTITEKFDPSEDLSGYVEGSQTPDIVIAFDDDSLQQSAREKSSKTEADWNIYGIGVSESSVYYLDHGIIQGIAVPDNFNMGYESITLLASHIRNKHTVKQNITIDCFAVRPEDVHNSETERKLFPVIN